MNTQLKKWGNQLNKITIHMIRKDEYCWIKIEPTTQHSDHTVLYIVLNNRRYHWDIYDTSGRDKHNIYFKGYQIRPCFYLRSKEKCFRIDCNDDGIRIHTIDEKYTLNSYLRNKCTFSSPQSTCWAQEIYSTSKPEEYPFDMI
jgi:hypothetical protein